MRRELVVQLGVADIQGLVENALRHFIRNESWEVNNDIAAIKNSLTKSLVSVRRRPVGRSSDSRKNLDRAGLALHRGTSSGGELQGSGNLDFSVQFSIR
jgi:hypothetical protein